MAKVKKGNLTAGQILEIKPGRSKTFMLASDASRRAARMTVLRTKRDYPREDVGDYTYTNGEPEGGLFPMTITAIAREDRQ